MLWKCCTQYASTFGKLSSGGRTGKGQFSFQSQRKAMPTNAQTTAQLHSSHMLAKSCSKFSKLGFNSTWTENVQMFKLGLEKAEDLIANIRWITEKARVPEKHLLLLYWLRQSLWLHGSQQTVGIPDHLTCLLRYLYAGQEATIRTGHGTTDWFQIGKEVHQGCILSPCLFNLYAEYIIRKLGWKKHKLESRLLGDISVTSDTQMTAPLWQKAKRN